LASRIQPGGVNVITLKTSDGAKFSGDSFEDLVIEMKLDVWVPPKTKEKYMVVVANRVDVFNGDKIYYHDSKSFILELLRIGVVTELVDNGKEIKIFIARKKRK
jgi:RecA-family ATPase